MRSPNRKERFAPCLRIRNKVDESVREMRRRYHESCSPVFGLVVAHLCSNPCFTGSGRGLRFARDGRCAIRARRRLHLHLYRTSLQLILTGKHLPAALRNRRHAEPPGPRLAGYGGIQLDCPYGWVRLAVRYQYLVEYWIL